MPSGSRRARGSLARRPVAPLVIGHRGAAGYRPENTLASYEIAARLGADYIEPDLVATAEGVLVARHEPEIGGSTDVARRPEFADRHRTVSVDGIDHTGWFTHDFTLTELRTLRATEPLPHIRQPNTVYDNRFGITTLDEILDLAMRLSVGLYVEVKHPAHFASIGIPLESAVARTLATAPDGMPVVVESFDAGFLRSIRDELDVSITQLVEEEDAALVTPDGLAAIATYAEGLGPAKGMVIPLDAGDDLGPPTSLVADAHAAGLLVFPYTFRNENRFLPAGLRRGTDPAHHGDAFGEYTAFLDAGIDGLFTDHPDTAIAAIEAYGRESWMMRA